MPREAGAQVAVAEVAVRELDSAVYSQIVKRWSVQHKRRRNLWQAFADKRLPTESLR